LKRVAGCGLRGAPLEERFALGALRSRSVALELEAFLPSRRKDGIFDKRSALQVKRSSSATLLFHLFPLSFNLKPCFNQLNLLNQPN